MNWNRTTMDAEVCVIGSGPAGALVAYSLAERGHDVVVLEAGKRFELDEHGATFEQLERAIRPEVSRGELWGSREPRDSYTTELPPEVVFELNEQRIKAVGGTTRHWSGYTPRLHEKDFEMHSRYGLAVDWPFGYDELRPYYALAEVELGVAGEAGPFGPPREQPYPMTAFPRSYTDELYAEACASLGIDVHPLPQARNSEAYDDRSVCVNYGTCTPFCPSGAQYNAGVHIRKAESDGVTVLDRAPVTRLEHDDAGERVTAAVYVRDDEEHRLEADQFVVACGAVETPRLLLLSASEQHPDGLANASGLVGRYFHAGLTVSTWAELDGPAQQEPVGFSTTHTEQFYDHDRPAPGSIHLVFRNENPPSPVRHALADEGVVGGLLSELTGASWGDDLSGALEGLDPATHRQLRLDSSVEQLPEAHNRVGLDRSRSDDQGNPVPKITFSVGSHALSTMAHALELHREIFAEMGATVTREQPPREQDVGNHHKGTTRMGEDPATSVVDPEGRTHDLANCWIVSSSVFPTGGAVPPTLTIAALALRTAEAIDASL